MRVATWNVGSMTTRSDEVAQELEKEGVDVCCLQETRWTGGGAEMVGKEGAYKLFWEGGEKAQAGVGFMVRGDWADKVIKVDILGDRIMALTLAVGGEKVRVVSAYAPQVGRTEKEKTEFWSKLEGVLVGIDEKEF